MPTWAYGCPKIKKAASVAACVLKVRAEAVLLVEVVDHSNHFIFGVDYLNKIKVLRARIVELLDQNSFDPVHKAAPVFGAYKYNRKFGYFLSLDKGDRLKHFIK